MSEINVAKLQVGDVPFASNGSQNTGRRPVDARRDVLGKNNLRTTINLLIDQVIEADDQNVKITGDQVINGRKEFTNIVITDASLPITGTEIILNQDSDTQATCKLVVNRGLDSTDASLVFNVSSQIWELFEDESTLSRLRLLAPVNNDEATTKAFVTAITDALSTSISNLDAAVVKKAVNATITGILTFDTTPKITNLPVVGIDAVNKTYVDSLLVAGIIVQNTPPVPVLGKFWLDISEEANLRLYYSDGAGWINIPTDIPRSQTAAISAGSLSIEVNLGNNVFVEVDEDFTLEDLDFTGLTASNYNGYPIRVAFKQGASGGNITAFGSKYRFSADIPDLDLSVGVGKVDYVGLVYHAGDDKIDIVAVNKGFE